MDDELAYAATQAARLAEMLRQALRTREVTSEVAMLATEVNGSVDNLWKKTRG